nr:hypothetical protein [uncultured Methanobacterium sp.]
MVGLWIADNYLDGAINGITSTFITSLIFFPVLLLIYYPTMFSLQPLETTLLWTICILLGGLGAIIGVSIQKMISAMQKWRLKSRLKCKDYLLCTKCGGYYELKDDETPEDYAKCECGGKLEYKEPFKSDKKSEDLNKSSFRIRIIAITVGAIIYFLVPFNFLIPLAGFVTSLIAGGRYKDGIINSTVAVCIGGLLLIFSGLLGYSIYGMGYMSVSEWVIGLFQDIIAGIVGGIIGIYIKNRRNDKGVIKGTFVCDKCKSYYELSPGETPEDYDLTCECGGKIRQAKKTSLIVLIIGYIFAISGGVIGLFIGWYLYSLENPNAKFHGRNITVIAIISITVGLLLFFSHSY